MTCEIRIGTSGYSFDDWIGPFYPVGIKKGKMLDYYGQYFNTVEINSTYYRIPDKFVFYHLDKKTGSDFEFIVKLNKSTTHGKNRDPKVTESIISAVSSLIDSDKLRGFLAQFPWAFRMSHENIEYLRTVRQHCGNIPLFVEFRHNSWDREEVYRFLDSEGIGYTCVDEPPLQGMLPPQSRVTSGTGYIRLHGRNSKNWWDASQGDRYDYLYSENELEEWISRLREIRQKSSKAYVFFNNCHQGHAVRNAIMFIEMLSKNPDFALTPPAILT